MRVSVKFILCLIAIAASTIFLSRLCIYQYSVFPSFLHCIIAEDYKYELKLFIGALQGVPIISLFTLINGRCKEFVIKDEHEKIYISNIFSLLSLVLMGYRIIKNIGYTGHRKQDEEYSIVKGRGSYRLICSIQRGK